MTLPIRTTICAFWLFATAAGVAFIFNYEKTAGSTGKTPQRWPAGTQITLDSSRDTLVMFAHPQCPCTRASVEELNRLLAQCRGQAAAHVFFFKPTHFPKNWAQTDLWRSASAIPGVVVHEDSDGALAKKFGAQTSGFTALYNPQGELLFSGGITSGRGHIGDNAGESALAALLTGRDNAVTQTPVFGCSLLAENCSKNLP
jgi:hypothetical protein